MRGPESPQYVQSLVLYWGTSKLPRYRKMTQNNINVLDLLSTYCVLNRFTVTFLVLLVTYC